VIAESLIDRQIRLEYAVDENGLLVPYEGSTEQARFIVHRHVTGVRAYYRYDLPPEVREQLARLLARNAECEAEAVCRILAAHSPCSAVFTGTSCVFQRLPDPAEFPDAVMTSEGFGVFVGGVRVAVAWSVRENQSAAELAVETARGFRRRGFGRQVAAAWGRHIMAAGKTAFYSYERANVASRGLARSLGVVEFSTVAAYD
jgi:hypothetical protein